MQGNEALRDILLIQKREMEKRLSEDYVEREAHFTAWESDLIKVIMGPRRSGKSFFAIHMMGHRGNFGYVNFDDERLVEVEDYDNIIAAINSLYSNPEYLLFDEIQNLPKWEILANRLQRQGYNLILTGSNSKLLSREMATHLTGRHLLLTILPFSFGEILKYEGKEMTGIEMREKMREYLIYGGYPEPLIKKLDYREYLALLFSSIIYKDIVKRFNIRFVQAMEDLAVYLISNTAREFSYNALTGICRCKSVHTVQKYLGYLEEAFLFFKIDRFAFKVKEQIASNKKIYCIDNGLVHAKAFKSNPELGRLLENAVAVELKKSELNGLIRMYYWKNPQQEEVDFVIRKGNQILQLIQVCYEMDDRKTRERETRALLKAGRELKCENIMVVTGDYENEEQVEWFGMKAIVRFIPFWKWLQDGHSRFSR